MSVALAYLALAAAIAVLMRRRRARRRTSAALRRAVGAQRWHRVLSMALVIGIVGACVTMPALLGAPSASATAAGLDCKDPPAPETPGDTSTDYFDSNADVARGDGTAYGTYGWAGLVWHTYDLGCGPDVVRAPAAVWDTQLGNAGLAIAKWTTGLAVWLDRESQINPDGSSYASTVFGKLDSVVASGSAALRKAFYDPWAAVGVLVVGILVLYFAMKAAGSSAMRKSVVAGLALFLAGLAIGLPLTTIHEVDHTFNAAIGRVRDDALRKIGTNPTTGPREAVINHIIIRQWKVGEFGDPDSVIAARLGGKLRDAQALTYDDVDKQNRLLAQCAKVGSMLCNFDTIIKTVGAVGARHSNEYTQLANQIQSYGSDAYGQFIGKRENRTSAGWIAALESIIVNALWIAASILRFVGLLIVRLAVLFAPIWAIPAMVSEQVLGRVVRFVGAALFLAIIASAAVAADLVALTGVLRTDLSPGWQTFVMLLISGVLWMALRPIKRLTQLIGMNHNATIGHAFGLGKRAMGGLLGYQVGKRVGRSDEADSDTIDRNSGADTVTSQAQEGTRRTSAPPLELAAATAAPDHDLPAAASRRSRPATAEPANAEAETDPATPLGRRQLAAARLRVDPQTAGDEGTLSRLGEPSAGTAAENVASTSQAVDKNRRIVTLDEIGRVVDVHDALYDPGEPHRAPHRIDADGELVHELYSPPSEESHPRAETPAAVDRELW